MAFVMKDAFFEIDGVDLSCHVTSVEITLSKSEVEANTMCGQATLSGIEQSSITVNFLQSFEVGEVDDTLYPIWADEEEVTVNIRPHQTAVAPDNPQYSAQVRLFEYSPLAGSVNERAETSVTFPVQGVITRADA